MAQQKPVEAGWPIRTTYAELKPAAWFLAHPYNVAIHPQAQREPVAASLQELGWVKPVIVNRRTAATWGADQGVETVIDGHLRVAIALSRGDDTPVPVDYCDLSPAQEPIALMLLDQMVTYRVIDREQLARLAAEAKPADAALQALCAAMCAEAGLTAPSVEPVSIHEQGRGDPPARVECPACGARFVPTT